jgi:hypothetical protein
VFVDGEKSTLVLKYIHVQQVLEDHVTVGALVTILRHELEVPEIIPLLKYVAESRSHDALEEAVVFVNTA